MHDLVGFNCELLLVYDGNSPSIQASAYTHIARCQKNFSKNYR